MKIRAENISKHFGSFVAVSALTAAFERGKAYVVAGPNGAGKTTFLKILAGLITPTHGKITVEGSICLGVMMQESYLYRDLTPRENLELYAKLSGISFTRIKEVSDLFGLKDFIDHDVATLSHGQKRRASFARAVLTNPDVLILDEPFLGLDTVSVSGTLHYLEKLKASGGMALIATHELDIVKGCADRLLMLEAGQMKYFDRFNV